MRACGKMTRNLSAYPSNSWEVRHSRESGNPVRTSRCLGIVLDSRFRGNDAKAERGNDAKAERGNDARGR